MQDVNVCFCAECMNTIISSRLKKFWQCLCFSAVTDKTWMFFKDTDAIAERYIKALEKKNLIVSTDHKQYILVRPRGIYEHSHETYIVCQSPFEHDQLER